MYLLLVCEYVWVCACEDVGDDWLDVPVYAFSKNVGIVFKHFSCSTVRLSSPLHEFDMDCIQFIITDRKVRE